VPGITWKNETITGPTGSGDGVMIHGGEATGVVHFRGTVPLGQQEFQVLGAVPNPELFAATALRELLRSEGIEVVGEAAPVGEAKAGEVELIKHVS
jgi:D-alanyl-D-alanine carboxypeptidase/D-alanyl-D-alanine-endopeptidase (penicillin-binding protein 4)